MAAAFMVSYTRAKSESLGFTSGTGMASIGLAPREVRLAILAIGLIVTGLTTPFVLDEFCSPDPLNAGVINCLFTGRPDLYFAGAEILAIALGLITILATITTIQRILHVRAQSLEG